MFCGYLFLNFLFIFYQQDHSQSYAQFTPCLEQNKHPVENITYLACNVDLWRIINSHIVVENLSLKFYFTLRWIFIFILSTYL